MPTPLIPSPRAKIGTRRNSCLIRRDMAYVQNHWIYLDHDQAYSGTAGVSYRYNESRTTSTMGYMDVVAGSGLRQDATAADRRSNPSPTARPFRTITRSTSACEQTFKVAHKQYLKARLDVVNVTDNTYELRSGSGVGVNAAAIWRAPRDFWFVELLVLTY